MSTLAVIPARLGATRLPQKPIRLLGGAPLVVRVWERVVAMNVADQVVVATDSDVVARVCLERGADVTLTREDHVSGTDRVAEVASQRAYADFSVLLNVQGDEPWVAAEAVRGALALVGEGRCPVGTAAVRIHPDNVDEVLAAPSVVKVVVNDAGRALYFSRAAIPFLRDVADAAVRAGLARQHIGVYAYTRAALAQWVALPQHPLEITERLEQLRPLAAGVPIGVATIEGDASGGIDTEDDLALANARWTAQNEDDS